MAEAVVASWGPKDFGVSLDSESLRKGMFAVFSIMIRVSA